MKMVIPIILVLTSALIVGCLGQAGPEPGPGGVVTTGKVYFTITDSKLDMVNVTSVLATIDKIEVHKKAIEAVRCRLSLCDCQCYPEGQTPEELNGTLCGINCLGEFNVSGCKAIGSACGELVSGQVDNSTGSWVTVMDAPTAYDLLALTNVEQLVKEIDLASGDYNIIRLYISNVNVTYNGTTREAKLPSGKIDINIAFIVEANKTHLVSLDFNLNDSLHITGEGQIIMAPVIKAEVNGNVELQLQNGKVTRVRAEKQAETEVGMDENGNVGVGKGIDDSLPIRVDANGRVQTQRDGTWGEREECKERYEVTVTQNSVTPKIITVCEGSVVQWTFTGNVAHRLVSESGGFNSGDRQSGMVWSYTADKLGSFHYRDYLNRAIEGTIVVEPAS